MNAKSSPSDLLLCQFTRPLIEAGDFSGFLNLWHLDQLPRGPALRARFDTLVFSVGGFDDDPREIYAVPEVRRFYQAFHRAWPFWLFFCSLDTPDLQAMTWCCLDSVRILQHDAGPFCRVQYDSQELGRFLQGSYEAMNYLFERAEMSEEDNRHRSRRVYEYYRNDWLGSGLETTLPR